MRSSGTSSSSPTIWRMAMRPPVPMSTLPTKTVTAPPAQLDLVGEVPGEARGGDLGEIERRRPVEDPLGHRLAERGRDAEAADAAAVHHPGTGHTGQRPREVAVVHRERRQPAAVLGDADRRILEDWELLAHAAREPPQHLAVQRHFGDI